MTPPDDSQTSAPAADDAAEAEPPEPLSLTIVHQDGGWEDLPGLDAAIRKAAAALADHPRLARAQFREASIALASDAAVARLNRTYRGKDGATNVLSFPYQVPPGAEGGAYLGDIVLAAETVRREAEERGIPTLQHVQHLVVHGLLHLLGYDHAGDADAAEMEGLEVEVLATIGIADPYAACAAI
jgi:probable rRNA maturation factor